MSRESALVDPESQTIRRPSVEGPSQQILSARGTESLRESAIDEHGHAKPWGDVVAHFEDYIMTTNASDDTWFTEKGVPASSHRFSPRYADRQYGTIHGGLRWIGENTPDSLGLWTVLFTFEGWPYDDDGRPAPPVDFLAGLCDGREAALRTARRSLDAHERVRSWGAITVREPHRGRRAGYPHEHDGIVIVGPTERSTVESIVGDVVERYVENNPFARSSDHGDGAVRIEDAHEDGMIESFAAELTNDLIGYEFSSDDGTPFTVQSVDYAVRRFAALFWATGRRSVILRGGDFPEWIERSQEGWSPDDADESTDPPSVDYENADPVEYVDPEPTTVEYQFPDESDGDGDDGDSADGDSPDADTDDGTIGDYAHGRRRRGSG